MKKAVGRVLAILMVSSLFFASAAFAAGDVNVAKQAKVTASSEFNADNAAANAVDGKPVKHGSGEWASKGEIKPWLKLEWAKAVTINKIIVYDRPNTLDNANGGTITFSDGSTLDVMDIDPVGKPTEITFAAKTVTSFKFDINGAGSNVGLAEIEVFGQAAAAPATQDKAATTDTKAAASNPKTGDAGTIPYLILAGFALIIGTSVMIKKRKIV